MTREAPQRSRVDSCRPTNTPLYMLGTACAGHASTADRAFLKIWAEDTHRAGEEPILDQEGDPAVPASPSLPTSSCSTLCTRSSFTAM